MSVGARAIVDRAGSVGADRVDNTLTILVVVELDGPWSEWAGDRSGNCK